MNLLDRIAYEVLKIKIETYWNVNKKALEFIECNADIKIETYWNIIFIFHPAKDRKLNYYNTKDFHL